MRRLPNNALHKALIKFLRENVKAAVYDYVPDEITLPYITLGAINVQDKSTKLDDMTHLTVQIHLWSSYKGRYEINVLAENIINLLSDNQLNMAEDRFFANAQGVDFYESFPEDEEGYHGVISFEIMVQNIEGAD